MPTLASLRTASLPLSPRLDVFDLASKAYLHQDLKSINPSLDLLADRIDPAVDHGDGLGLPLGRDEFGMFLGASSTRAHHTGSRILSRDHQPGPLISPPG
jgi:hypothetical protein